MSVVLILGAGFSHAISPANMPLTSTLVRTVRHKDSDPHELEQIPELRNGQDLERWLSSIAEQQPYLDERDNALNAALFVSASRAIQDTILHAQHVTMADGPVPAWLDDLVRFLHVGTHTVITFNYDTLLERAMVAAIRTMGRPYAQSDPHFHAERVKELPPLRAAKGMPTTWGSAAVPTFQLVKLHGSLDAWWVPGDVSGETISREPASAWGDPSPRWGSKEDRPAGKEPFIVPPASTKSAYYANPISRQLWRDSREALLRAERVCIVGYSLPLTDLTVGNLISDALGRHNPTATIEIVDVDPGTVAANLEAVGIPSSRVTKTLVDPAVGLAPWVADLTAGFDLELHPPA